MRRQKLNPRKILIRILFVLVIFTGDLFSQSKTSELNVYKGIIERLENFDSKFVKSRNIDIWLPEGYNRNDKYAVLYMHDGQMLYDSSATWNKQEWKVDEVLSGLMEKGEIKKCIVVGIWNSDEGRHSDYYPQKAFDLLSDDFKHILKKNTVKYGGDNLFPKGIQSDNYLKFLVKELKPFIDKHYSTFTDKENTFIAGSSMGGLISMYAICEYPEIFGGAACISTHWIGFGPMPQNDVPRSFVKYLEQNLPEPGNNKIYFDFGTETLDQYYEPSQKLVDEVMKKKGYDERNWKTQKFPGENHSEKSWSKRLHIPVLFLLGKK